MPYYLELDFEPDFAQTHKRMPPPGQGRLERFNLGYVQNVVQGQVLALWRDVEVSEALKLDPARLYPEKSILPGANACHNPENPDEILAASSGYPVLEDNKISVRRVLHLPRDVDAHTGNIFFLGDVQADGVVRSGFSVQARNIRVMAVEEGARLLAEKSILVDHGVSGSNATVIEAGEHLKAGFCENAILAANHKMIIEGGSVNCKIYAGEYLAVKGTLKGRKAYVRGQVMVAGQLGGRMGITTQIILGYDPTLLLKAKRIEMSLVQTADSISHFKVMAAGDDPPERYLRRIEHFTRRQQVYLRQKQKVWERIHAELTPERLAACRLQVPGTVYPGTEISIGGAVLAVEDTMQNVEFRLAGEEIRVQSLGPGRG